ncbi:MAG: endolytic transglycosylase MltG [Cellulomonadaceae bacterium]|nr:endolytic transglycosylase MltG [Cellulomonadaceae bacterium]
MTDLFDSFSKEPEPEVQHSTRSARRRHQEAKAASIRKRRGRGAKRFLILVLAVAVVGGIGYATWQTVSGGFHNPFAQEVADYDGPGGAPLDIEIPQGSTGTSIGELLYTNGVVASPQAFTNAYKANPRASGIQPGHYQLLSQMKASDALAALIEGDKIEDALTIPEGYTVAQIVDKVQEVTSFTADQMNAALASPESFGLPAEANGKPEGWLFAGTYTVTPSDTPETLLTAMVTNTTNLLSNAGVADADRETVLIKASLVEREAKLDDDRPKVARAIQNRLDQGMPLQIDAAVAYGAGKPGTELTTADLENANNPFNTYVHKGLPPTPIASPSQASINAVLAPTPGDWLYWVTVNLDTGETKFASTYEQHQKNVEELRKWQAAHG